MAEIRHLENRHDVIFFCWGWSDLNKISHRLVQNDMSTAVIGSKSKPDVEFQYGGRLGEFNGLSSQSHVSRCRVLPLGEFTVMISEPHATLQGVRIPSAILKICFRHSLFYFFSCSPARSAAMPVLFLLSGPKMCFSPCRGDTLPL